MLGVTFYGLGGNDRLLAPSATPGIPSSIIEYKSVWFDLPILEYRPYRSFASNQSTALLFQFFTAWDVPYSASVVSPAGAPTPNLNTVLSIGLRMSFDWRFYP